MFSKKIQIPVFIMSLIAAFFFYNSFTLDIIKTYMNNISEQGLAIYAIFGVWITIIYPECLTAIKNKENIKTTSEFNSSLIYPLVFGTITLIIALIFKLFAPIFVSKSTVLEHKEVLRYLSALIIFWSYIEQILSFLCSLIIVYDIKRNYSHTKAIDDVERTMPPVYQGKD